MRVEGGPVGARFAPHVACCVPWVACCMLRVAHRGLHVACCMVHVACRAVCVACCMVCVACCMVHGAHASAGRAAGGPVGAEADEKSSGLPAPSGAAKGLGRRGSVMGPMALRAVSLAWFVRAFSSSSCTRTNGRCEERRRCDQRTPQPCRPTGAGVSRTRGRHAKLGLVHGRTQRQKSRLGPTAGRDGRCRTTVRAWAAWLAALRQAWRSLASITHVEPVSRRGTSGACRCERCAVGPAGASRASCAPAAANKTASAKARPDRTAKRRKASVGSAVRPPMRARACV